MQVPAIIFHQSPEKPAFDNMFRYLITSSVVHFRSSLLFVPDPFDPDLFLFPFNTGVLLPKHREAVYGLRLHSDQGRPTTIFYTTFDYLTTDIQFTAHSRLTDE